jgi:bifunctional DNA-binding transcriptional regulator/antitoxin component of YhaV-PrlF toxin-antitoxin module
VADPIAINILLLLSISAILTIRHSDDQYIRKELQMQSFTLHVAQRGLVTLPQELRKAHDIRPGQEMTLLDLDGVFVLSPQPSHVDALADRIADELAGRGETLASMLQTLREVRTEYA